MLCMPRIVTRAECPVTKEALGRFSNTFWEAKMDSDGDSASSRDVRELLRQALELLDARRAHLIGAHVAHAIIILERDRDQS